MKYSEKLKFKTEGFYKKEPFFLLYLEICYYVMAKNVWLNLAGRCFRAFQEQYINSNNFRLFFS